MSLPPTQARHRAGPRVALALAGLVLALFVVAACHDLLLGPEHHDYRACHLCYELVHVAAPAATTLIILLGLLGRVRLVAVERPAPGVPPACRSRSPPADFVSSSR